MSTVEKITGTPVDGEPDPLADADVFAWSVVEVDDALEEAVGFDERLHPRNRLGQFRRVIAIDGPAASGKSTVARMVAEQVGGSYIDTGAYFRTAGLAKLRGRDPVETLRSGAIRPRGSSVTLDDEDVSADIRTAEVDRQAAELGGDMEVRAAVKDAIADLLDEGGVFVADGRDAGNALDAEVRVFLTADLDTRARRRAEGRGQTEQEARQAIKRRDEIDAPRIEQAREGADVVIDNTGESAEQTVERITAAVRPRYRHLPNSPVEAARIRQHAAERRWGPSEKPWRPSDHDVHYDDPELLQALDDAQEANVQRMGQALFDHFGQQPIILKERLGEGFWAATADASGKYSAEMLRRRGRGDEPSIMEGRGRPRPNVYETVPNYHKPGTDETLEIVKEPGVASTADLGSVIRHEWFHYVEESLSIEEMAEYRRLFPLDEEGRFDALRIARDVTTNAGENWGEAAAEVFAITTHPEFRADEWEPWVSQAGYAIIELLYQKAEGER